MVRVVRMKLHLKIHNGFKPYNCESCSRSFANKSSLREHVRFHHLGAPKPYMCSGCGITFGNKGMLKIHEMTHTDEKVTNSIMQKLFNLNYFLLFSSRLSVPFATRNIDQKIT
jgi:uncharacterized Zn-finger protein